MTEDAPLPPGVVRTLRALAEASNYSQKTISEWRNRPGFPVEGDGTYDIWAVCCWWHKQEALKAARKSANVPEELEPGAGDSPWLEKYREVKTHRENLKLETERKNLIPRQSVHDMLMQIANLIRGAGETLQTQFGPAALDVLDTTLTEAETIINAAFGPDDSDSDSDEFDPADGPEPTGPAD